MLKSIVSRLWLSVVLVVVALLLVLGLLLSQLFDNFYFNLQAQNLIEQGQNLGKLVLSSPSDAELLRDLALVEDFLNANVVIMDKSGLIQSVSPGMMWMHRWGGQGRQRLTPPQAAAVLAGRTVVMRGYQPGVNATVLTVAVPIKVADEVVGAVYLYAPLAPITRTIAAVRRLILYGILVTLVVATVLAFFLSRRISRPLIHMERAAQAMAAGDFSPRVNVRTDDEVGRLGQALNHLAEELARTLDALGAERDQLASILGSMTDGVITFDAGGAVLIFNPPAASYLAPLTELTAGQKLGVDISLPELEEAFRQVVETGAVQGAEVTAGAKVLACRLAPLRDPRGTVRGVVCVLLDMTRERRLEEMRREFVANVSHELRTPLTYLQGYTEAILDGLAADPAEEKKYLKIILDETLRLRRLVSDLLDLSRIEARQLALEKGEVNLAELCREVAEKVRPLAEEKGIRLELNVPAALPAAWGNTDRLQQVLINLLDNALRHTRAGGKVEVTAEVQGEELAVSVRDTGPGIPPEDLPYIFERFYKVEKARTRTTAGTGIGLAIVKGLVEAHGGRVWVESTPGRGSVFTFTLPTAGRNIGADGEVNLE
ncbi:MAG: two-component system, OmpR family, sensor histidine kinase ResE [Bacillota bacterium]|nr:two-component system, OmpR family, sensor histidine kinase ResE [Bacillota bacterium]MDK2960159.1 two-component system, OmpR family, sensor histidine kinase ResE [Bacillota bacterium]